MAGSQDSPVSLRNIASFPGDRGRAASVVAVCLLAAQLIAAAHVHAWNNSGITSRASHPVITDAVCAVCVLQAHAPLCAAAVPILPQPTVCALKAACAALSHPLVAPKCQRYGRAPPAFA